MRGTVLGFDATTGEGVVADASGVRHNFSTADWKSGGTPAMGQAVDYSVSGDRATDVYAVPGATGAMGGPAAPVSPQQKEAQTAGIIGLVCSILSYPFFFIGWILAAVGIYYGIKAKNLGAGLPTNGPRYMGIAAIILSVISIFVSLGFWALFGCSMVLSLAGNH